MHHAMNHDGRRAFAMRLEHLFHKMYVVDIGEAFVVNDDVVSSSPIGLLVNADAVLGGCAAFLYDFPFDIGAPTDAFGNDHLLPIVIMAASAGNEHRA